MCFVKNFRVGQFSGHTRGAQTTSFPPWVAHRSERLKFPKAKSQHMLHKNFRVGQFLCDICWL